MAEGSEKCSPSLFHHFVPYSLTNLKIKLTRKIENKNPDANVVIKKVKSSVTHICR